jgi:hypothetical protein
MTEERTEFLLVENSIELLTDFFQVIYDGYNPAVISVTTKLNQNLDERDYFVLPSHLRQEDYFESVMRTRKEIESVPHRITENFQWCLDHLITFNQLPALFDDKFYFDNLKALVQKVRDRVIKVVENWQIEASEYSIGPEIRILLSFTDKTKPLQLRLRVLFIERGHSEW